MPISRRGFCQTMIERGNPFFYNHNDFDYDEDEFEYHRDRACEFTDHLYDIFYHSLSISFLKYEST